MERSVKFTKMPIKKKKLFLITFEEHFQIKKSFYKHSNYLAWKAISEALLHYPN